MKYDRRTLPRWQINNRVLLRLKQGQEELYCQIKDINYIGAQVILHDKLPIDKLFKMSLCLSGEDAITVKAWVSWHKLTDGANHYGIYFNQINDEDKDKIDKFVKTYHPQDDLVQMPRPGVIGVDGDQGGQNMDDHRIFERFRKEFSARFIGLDGRECSAQTFDVSAKGLGLVTGQPLEASANLEIWLNIPNSTDPLYTRGQVVWSKSAEKGNFRSGIELERADLMGVSRLLRS